MKRTLTLILAVLLCMTVLVSCIEENNKPDTENKSNVTENYDGQGGKKVAKPDKTEKEDTSLTELRKEISDSGAILGVAYLGYNDETFEDIKEYLGDMGFYKKYPFVEDMDLDSFCVTGGSELYLVVPASKDMAVEVYAGVPNLETYSLDKGELIEEITGGKPFIVRGNESEIISNIILECDGFEYYPCLSGEDGEIVETDGLYDFSPYSEIKEYFGIESPDIADGADAVWNGIWFGEAETGDYELVSMILGLYADGTADYSYGYGNSEVLESFVGEWSYDVERDMILLDMYGGPINDDYESDELYVDPYELQCGFKWYMDYRDDGTYLVLTHEEGNPILWGKNGATFEFSPMMEQEKEDYSYLEATWAIISEKTEIFLELFEDGSANFSKSDNNGNESRYHGIWSADGLTLYLDLYDENEKLFYSGEYGIMYDGELLTLSHHDGDALTSFMSEQGYDSFMFYGVG